MSEFQRSLQKVLVHEGGWSNHPADPGGATMKGVTQRVYDSYRAAHNLAKQTVGKITTAELEAIYKVRYWDLFKGDRFPPGVGYVVFDGAVNSGVGQSVKWLQRALGSRYTGAIDGLVGEGTLAAINAHPDHDALIASICKLRLAFLKSLKTWPTFGRGWTSRVNGVLVTGQAWADNRTAPMTVVSVDGGNAKALPEDVQATPTTGVADASTGGGIVAVTITQAIGQLSPLAASPAIAQIVTYLTIAGIVVTVGGLLYSAWAKRKAAKIAAAT